MDGFCVRGGRLTQVSQLNQVLGRAGMCLAKLSESAVTRHYLRDVNPEMLISPGVWLLALTA